MEKQLIESLSEAFTKNDIISQCENKLIEVHKLLDQTTVQTNEVVEFKRILLEQALWIKKTITNNYLFENDIVTGQPREKFPK